MILTVTPNPSLDLLFDTDRLTWDDANRIPMPRRRAGGQGVNLVRAVVALDPSVTALAIAPLGGAVGRELREMLAIDAAPLRAVDLDGETRVFVGVRERETGRSLLLNPRGPEAAPELAERLLEAVDSELAGRGPGAWVACCGSLLPGLPADLYARIGALARQRGARFIPDCDGEALTRAVEAGADLLAPNAHEAGRLVGRALGTPGDAARAAAELLAPGTTLPGDPPTARRTGEGHRRRSGPPSGPRRVVVTLGADGAVGADARDAWWARASLPAGLQAEAREGSAVGAGDAFLAALVLAFERGEGLRDALVEAVATGTATLLGRGRDLVRPADVARVRPHVRIGRPTG